MVKSVLCNQSEINICAQVAISRTLRLISLLTLKRRSELSTRHLKIENFLRILLRQAEEPRGCWLRERLARAEQLEVRGRVAKFQR